MKVNQYVLQIAVRSWLGEAGRESGLDQRGKIISSTGNGTKTARTLEKGLMILSLFDAEHPRWTLTSISEATSIPMPTALRLARTLEKSRYLRQDARTRSYELGSAIYKLGSVMLSHSELIPIAHPHLERLSRLTTESAGLAVWQRGEAHIIDIVLTPRPFKPANPVGRIIPGLGSACGRVTVAFSPDDVLEAALAMDHPRLTEHTITDPVQLRGEIERIRREGVAFGIETNTIGVCTVAAPIFDSTGKVAASMAVVAPTERFGPVQMREYGAAALREATLVSHELGYAAGLGPHSPAPASADVTEPLRS